MLLKLILGIISVTFQNSLYLAINSDCTRLCKEHAEVHAQEAGIVDK